MKNDIIKHEKHIEIIIKRRNGEIFKPKICYDGFEKISKYDYKWHVWYNKNNDSFYVMSTVYIGTFDDKPKYDIYYLHRLLTDATDNEYVDHINHDTLDNTLTNLRITTNDSNLRNRKGANSNNKTGYRNVCYIKSEGKYIVQLQIDGKNTRLGSFDDVDEAGEFAKKMRKKYYKESLI